MHLNDIIGYNIVRFIFSSLSFTVAKKKKVWKTSDILTH